MKVWLVARDIGFYPLVFGIWAIILFAVHGNHPYFGTPVPCADFSQDRTKTIVNNMDQLQKSLATEKTPKERAHILENIGIGYFELYRSSHNPHYLDSAHLCFEQSISLLDNVPSFYYNLARICSERKDFVNAKLNYQKTITIDPRHFMSYHNLGLLYYYELKDPDQAMLNFQKALSIDSVLPVENYMLGEISIAKKDLAAAVQYYEKEVGLFLSKSGAKHYSLAEQGSTQLAATLSSLQLAILYSTSSLNPERAQDFFNLYLKLETDPRRKENSIKEIQKYWVLGKKDALHGAPSP